MTPGHPFPPGSKIGLTTTIPVEVVLAANLIPVDLNNLFIADPDALDWVSQAEAAGFPRTICAWVRGIYASLQDHPEIRAVHRRLPGRLLLHPGPGGNPGERGAGGHPLSSSPIPGTGSA